MTWFATHDGRLINLDQVTDIEPSTVYRTQGIPWLSRTAAEPGDEEIAGAWLTLAGGSDTDSRFLLIDAEDLARLRALLTKGGAR